MQPLETLYSDTIRKCYFRRLLTAIFEERVLGYVRRGSDGGFQGLLADDGGYVVLWFKPETSFVRKFPFQIFCDLPFGLTRAETSEMEVCKPDLSGSPKGSASVLVEPLLNTLDLILLHGQ